MKHPPLFFLVPDWITASHRQGIIRKLYEERIARQDKHKQQRQRAALDAQKLKRALTRGQFKTQVSYSCFYVLCKVFVYRRGKNKMSSG